MSDKKEASLSYQLSLITIFRTQMTYQCATCGATHDDLPDISDDKPYYWYTVPEEERSRRTFLTEEVCVIDDEDFFIRGVINLPVHGYHRDFGFGVWVSQKRENFLKYIEEPESSEIGPFFGWLSTEIRFYEESTLSLKTMAHFPGGTERPTIEVEPTEHPLAVDQIEGITVEKAWEIVHFYMDLSGDEK